MIKLSEDNIGEYMYGLRLGKEDTKSTDHKEKPACSTERLSTQSGAAKCHDM